VPSAKIVANGDILLSTSGTIGKTFYVSDTLPKSVVSNGITIVRGGATRIVRHYLAAILRSQVIQDQLDYLAEGSTTLRHVTIAKLKSLQIPVPSVDIQIKVAEACKLPDKDAFEELSRLLDSSSVDPFEDWLKTNQSLALFLKGPSLSTLQEASQEIVRMRELGAHDSSYVSSETAQLYGEWLSAMGAAAGSLNSIQKIEDDRERFHLLQLASAEVDRARFALEGCGRNAPLFRRVYDLTNAFRTVLSNESALVISNQDFRIEEIEDEGIVRFDLKNEGPLPILDVSLHLEPLGEIHAESSLMPGASTLFIPGAQEAWRGTIIPEDTAPGTPVDLTVELKGRVNSSEEGTIVRKIPFTIVAPSELKVPEKDGSRPASGRLNSGQKLDSVNHTAKIRELFRKPGLPARQNTAANRLSREEVGYSPGLGTQEELRNPYATGNPVPTMLYGRSRILRKMSRQLPREGEGDANVILLEGNRRSGKTSILKHLEEFREYTPGWLPVYCDCQAGDGEGHQNGLPTHVVWRSFASAIGKALIKEGIKFPLPNGEPQCSLERHVEADQQLIKACRQAFSPDHAFETFKQFLESVITTIRPTRILLMLDELDKLQDGITAKVTSPNVFHNLRHLVHNLDQFTVILAGSPRLKDLREDHWSALYGFGLSVQVSALKEEDAVDLITKPVSKSIQYSERAIGKIIDETSAHPYLIQLLCTETFDLVVEDPSQRLYASLRHVEEAADELVDSCGHFRDCWEIAGNARRRLILSLVWRNQQEEIPATMGYLEEELQGLGLDCPDEDRIGQDIQTLRELELITLKKSGSSQYYTLAIPLFGRWLDDKDFEDTTARAISESNNQED
jgi:hypothetical protein